MARLLRFMGARILAINSSGKTDQEVDFVGTLADLEACLGQADMAIVTLPLTDGTIGIIGARELGWVKPDGYIINISRGEIIDETALYEHLVAHPEFSAGIDAWWVEPLRHGRFEMKHPFLDLPNVIASPHNSAVAPDSMANTCRVAVENVHRYLTGGTVRGIAREIDWLTQNP
jgi:phosphoglycerate dehydrogenase-like enzyme